ncbi:uncharacterized protein LOC144710915 [Wolffia australiana]
MNVEHQQMYDTVFTAIDSTKHAEAKVFFVDGPGGSGKKFLYSVIFAQIKASRRNAISTATSCIVTLFLEGGRTLHSTFKILIPVNHISMCGISPDSKIGRQIQSASIIIVDEAPMMHYHIYETLKRSIRDVMKTINPSLESVPFNIKFIVMGGDFRQMLPAIPKGSRSMIISSSLNRSDRISSLPDLIAHVYGTFENGTTQLIAKMILTPLNDDVVKVNNRVIDVVPSEVMEYFSFNAIPPGKVDNESLCPTEFLNTIDDATMPLHKL